MVASAYMRVMDRKVVVTLSIYTMEASNVDQGLLLDIKKKDMINNITIIMTFMMLEPLNCSPTMFEKDCQLIGGVGQLICSDGQLIGCDGQLIGCDGQLIGCDGQLIACDGQLIAVYSNSSVSIFQLFSQCFSTNYFTNG